MHFKCDRPLSAGLLRRLEQVGRGWTSTRHRSKYAVIMSPVFIRKSTLMSLWSDENISPRKKNEETHWSESAALSLVFIFLTYFTCQLDKRCRASVPFALPCPHTSSLTASECRVCRMVVAESGWVEITLLSLLCCLQSMLRVSMATHSLENPPSKSRWSDDAVVCVCQVCSSPLCEPVCLVCLFPSEQIKQIHGFVVHKLK